MCDNSCPKCGSQSNVTSFVSLILSFENWDIALILAAVVFIAGTLQSISSAVILFFVVLAALPVLMAIKRKEFCESCNIEFIPRPIRASGVLPRSIEK
ncbi:MAG: hypothetical protein J0M12_09420 [Deltaproteobacteria bacterium]|nr:hypothetical protein [Deltaproteobacteria bacterium]